MNMPVVDATGHVVGRLAAVVAKRLLNGEEIVVVNAEKAIVTGRKSVVFGEYRAAPPWQYREPHAGQGAQLPAASGHDPPAHDFSHDALSATARANCLEAPARVPVRARRVQRDGL